MPTLDQYYNRFNPAQHYESHLFRAGYVLQSAELNEVQSALQWRTQGIGDALFKDGDVVRDAKLIVNVTTGVATGESGVIYLKGAVRGVPARTFTVPAIGTISVGITLIETWVTELEDPALRDPAVGVRNYQEPGAGRLRLEPRWSYAGETGVNAPVGEFYPIYTVVDGVVTPKQPPPNIDVVSAAIAVYDRDNSGGNYVISGYRVTAVPSITNGIQSVLVSSGRARVFGFPIEHVADSRLNRTADPDLRRISAEPHLADNSGLQRIDLDRDPVANIVEIQVQKQKTVTVPRGMITGGSDTLPDTSVLSLVSVSQGGTTYRIGTDVRLFGGKVDWALTGAEPLGGSSYSVTYYYIETLIPGADAWDQDGVTVADAIPGTLILVTYDAMLPRIDQICLNTKSELIWNKGISSDYSPSPSVVPAGAIGLAFIHQTWRSDELPQVTNNAIRTVAMNELQAMNARMDLLTDMFARQQLTTNTSLRETSLKKGLMVDPFLDNATRDLGTSQTAAIANGALSLPINTTSHSLAGSNQAPNVLTRTGFAASLKQESRSGGMKINPYMAGVIVPAVVTLNPAKDYWTEKTVVNTSSTVQNQLTKLSSQSVIIGYHYWWGYEYVGSSTSSYQSTSTSSLTTSSSKMLNYIENLRQIQVSVKIAGFGPGESVATTTFDGIPVNLT